MAGLLGDLYSYLDTKKRQVRGLLNDPLGEIAAGVQRFGEDWSGTLNRFANAYPMAGDKTVLNTPEQIAAFRKKIADEGAGMGMAAATVWHGSPHKFDKFDSSKIGTGEGAQAYGHGLYLAESPGVAGGYSDRLSSVRHNDEQVPRVLTYGKQNPRRIDMNAPSDTLSPAETALTYINLYGGKTFEASEALRDMASAGLKDSDKYKKALDVLTSGRLKTGKIGAEYGNIYKVDLPDEHIAKMLDWDKPLSQQAPEVIGAVQSLYGKDALGRPLDKVAPLNMDRAGRWAYENLQHGLGQARTSEGLQKAGIPGIRYLDGGSRGAGTGTSNYVIFPGNEGLLQILERNGAPL